MADRRGGMRGNGGGCGVAFPIASWALLSGAGGFCLWPKIVMVGLTEHCSLTVRSHRGLRSLGMQARQALKLMEPARAMRVVLPRGAIDQGVNFLDWVIGKLPRKCLGLKRVWSQPRVFRGRCSNV